MARRTKRKSAIDELIEKTYYRLAEGRQINIMDIGKVFDAGRDAYKNGLPVEVAIQAAVDKYTMVAG